MNTVPRLPNSQHQHHALTLTWRMVGSMAKISSPGPRASIRPCWQPLIVLTLRMLCGAAWRRYGMSQERRVPVRARGIASDKVWALANDRNCTGNHGKRNERNV
jgi:hypothetical protein